MPTQELPQRNPCDAHLLEFLPVVLRSDIIRLGEVLIRRAQFGELMEKGSDVARDVR